MSISMFLAAAGFRSGDEASFATAGVGTSCSRTWGAFSSKGSANRLTRTRRRNIRNRFRHHRFRNNGFRRMAAKIAATASGAVFACTSATSANDSEAGSGLASNTGSIGWIRGSIASGAISIASGCAVRELIWEPVRPDIQNCAVSFAESPRVWRENFEHSDDAKFETIGEAISEPMPRARPISGSIRGSFSMSVAGDAAARRERFAPTARAQCRPRHRAAELEHRLRRATSSGLPLALVVVLALGGPAQRHSRP